MPALVLSAVNRKGGVGKTSTAFHLAGHFAGMGLRVLLLDNDPQHSLTAGIVGSSPADEIDSEITVAALFDDQAYEQLLRKLYGEKVCRTVLPLSVHFKEAIAARKPVTLYRPKSAAALAIHELGEELAERMARLRALPPEFQYAGNRFAPGTSEPNQPEAL